ncbi:MAG: carboxypeptidase-like regulatory domain-containing protein [Flavobacteriales bacterium]|nr:carboxypeptidase-like regulatory domain-containing protein [Flavobacteriales bacterium]
MFRSAFLLSLLLFSLGASAQITQTIRGKVIDAVSQRGLPGATVMLMDSLNVKGAATDTEGEFKLEDIPIGRVSLKVSFIGYEDQFLQNLVLNPSKQLVLNVQLQEKINKVDEVVVKGERAKGEPLNEMAVISARAFSVEETRRFAGSWQDPARAAAAYAGVSGGSDERNDIIIRGNSPTSVLWRLEDINIPNPNHLSFSGSTGGPVSILNNNTLANSDFFTGAFPSEYGNANAGAFDLNLKRGNNEKREYYFQLGLSGLEFGLEGPFSKKHPASYMASYRYSTMAIIGLMGINFGISAIPYYQDLTFVIDVPTRKKAGRFTLWGIGGISSIHIKENAGFSQAGQEKRDQKLGSDMGATGLTHLIFLGEKNSLKTTFAATGLHQWQTDYAIVETDSTSLSYLNQYNKSVTLGTSFHTQLNTKISAKSNVRTGLIYDHKFVSFVDSSIDLSTQSYLVGLNQKDNFGLVQLYSQFHHRFSPKATGTLGLHGQMSTLSTSFAVEPRFGFKWSPFKRHSFSVGGGMHSQMLPALTYFYQTYIPSEGRYIRSNRNLGFSRSLHAVVGYDWSIIPKLRLKLEAYYQYMYKTPVEPTSSYFSMANAGASIGDVQVSDSLVNKGTGQNMGLEFTLEKFFDRGYYFLLTASLYNSTYKGSDGITRNSAFNGNYNLSALGGYEFKISRKNTLAFDSKITWTGGARYVPIDIDSSIAVGETVRDYSRAYEEKYKDYFRMDIKVTFSFNGKRASHSLALDFQNVFNTKNIFSRNYNPQTQAIETKYQLGFLPLVYYRVEF